MTKTVYVRRAVAAWWFTYRSGRTKGLSCPFYAKRPRMCGIWGEAMRLRALYADFCLRCPNDLEKSAIKYLLERSRVMLETWTRRTVSAARELKAEILEYQWQGRPLDRRLFPAEWTRACALTAIAERDRFKRLEARLDELEKGATTQ